MKKFVAVITILFVAFMVPVICAAIGLADAQAEEALPITWEEGTVVDAVEVYYKGSVCFLTKVDINGDIYEYYDSTRYTAKTQLKLQMVDNAIVGARLVQQWYHILLAIIIFLMLAGIFATLLFA